MNRTPWLLECEPPGHRKPNLAELQRTISGSHTIWDQLAEQASRMASEATDPKSRHLIEEIAERYEALARHSRTAAQDNSTSRLPSRPVGQDKYQP